MSFPAGAGSFWKPVVQSLAVACTVVAPSRYIEQRDDGRAGTVGGINFATFEYYVIIKT